MKDTSMVLKVRPGRMHPTDLPPIFRMALAWRCGNLWFNEQRPNSKLVDRAPAVVDGGPMLGDRSPQSCKETNHMSFYKTRSESSRRCGAELHRCDTKVQCVAGSRRTS